MSGSYHIFQGWPSWHYRPFLAVVGLILALLFGILGPSGFAPAAARGQAFEAWFPTPLPGWSATGAEVILNDSEITQVQKTYRRKADGAEMVISVLSSKVALEPEEKAMIDRMGGELGAKPFIHQGIRGLLLSGDGRSVLKFFLNGAKIEIDLMLDRMDTNPVTAYGRMLDLHGAERIFGK
jgi:hypothetical protein